MADDHPTQDLPEDDIAAVERLSKNGADAEHGRNSAVEHRGQAVLLCTRTNAIAVDQREPPDVRPPPDGPELGSPPPAVRLTGQGALIATQTGLWSLGAFPTSPDTVRRQ